MEKIRQLQTIHRTSEDTKWDYQNCKYLASEACTEHKHMLLCRDCKMEEHNYWDCIDYHSPKALSSLTLKVAAMIMHIREDWDLFNNK